MGSRRTASIDEKGVRKYTRIFLIITDDPVTDAGTVRDAPGTPEMFDSYEVPTNTLGTEFFVDDGATLGEKRPIEDQENPFRWELECNYSSTTGRPGDGEEDPMDRPATYDWDYDVAKEPVTQDIDGRAILNSADMAYDPPPEKDVAYDVLTIERNEDDFDPELAAEYAFAINLDSFMGYDPGQARMRPIKAKSQYENGQEFKKVTYVIDFREGKDPWHLAPLDQGPCENIDGKLVVMTDKNGQPLNGPALLNGDGRKLNIEIQDPVYGDHKIYNEKIFATLDLEP